jgi:branched-subunit amino acid ABC-type transport system permease component
VEFGASNFRHIFSFVFMILILLFRPGGLLGGKGMAQARGD